jgi:hypothetical protein
MLRFLSQIFEGGGGVVQTIILLAVLGFQIWMLVDAIRRREIIWAAIILLFSVFSAVIYYFLVYRMQGPLGNPMSGFELPGAADRRRIKELQASIHNLDKPHLHLQLGDIYFSQGKFSQAEESYRAAYARDATDEDIRAHLGTCLTRQGKAAEALPLLESVVARNPKHDYGYTLMTLAEAQTAAGQKDAARGSWQKVLSLYSYPRARVQYAELLVERKEYAEARKILQEEISDEPFEPGYQRKKEKVWLRRARAALSAIPR